MNARAFCVRSAQKSCPARWGGVLDVAFPSRRDEAAAPAGRARARPGRSARVGTRLRSISCGGAQGPRRQPSGGAVDRCAGRRRGRRRPVAAPAARARRRADGRQPSLPLDRPRGRPVRALLGGLHHHDPLGVDPADRRGAAAATPARSPGSSPARCSPSPWPARRWASSATSTATAASTGCSMACVCVFAGLTAAVVERRLADRVPHARRRHRRRRRAGVDRHHQPDVPARAAGAGDGLLVDGRRRWAGDRRGRGRPDRRDVRLALDLHRPGAAHLRRACSSGSSCCPRPNGATARASTSPAPASSRSAPPRSSSPSTAGRASGGRTRPSSPASSSRRWPSWPFVVVERRVEHPLLPLDVRAAPELLLRHRHPVLHELRLHGRLRDHADLPRVGVRLPGDARRWPDDRPAAGVRHHRSAGRATWPSGWGSARRRWPAPPSWWPRWWPCRRWRRGRPTS